MILPKYAAAKYTYKDDVCQTEKIQKEYETGVLQKSENKTMWLAKLFNSQWYVVCVWFLNNTL